MAQWVPTAGKLRLHLCSYWPIIFVMRWESRHRWQVTPAEAEQIQARLAQQGKQVSYVLPDRPARVAGAVVVGQMAVVVVLETAGWQVVDVQRAGVGEEFSYQPGLMAFAFGPALLAAFGKLAQPPELVFFRGHGIAHPRRCGMAAHVGLLLGVPAVGCADKLLVGQTEMPGAARGEWTSVVDGNDIVGACLRTQTDVKPLFVSPGYGVTVAEAVRLTLQATPHYRLPEPLRQARSVVLADWGLHP